MAARVILDANVFVSFWTFDVLMSFADEGLFEPCWSDAIEDEVLRACDRLGRSSSARMLLRSANRAFPNALVTGWEQGLRTVELPDPDDRHVVAAALAEGCEVIVTYNLRDFPQEVLEPLGLRAVAPDDYVMEQMKDKPVTVYCIIEDLIASKSRPSRTYDQEVDGLKRCGMKRFAEWLDS